MAEEGVIPVTEPTQVAPDPDQTAFKFADQGAAEQAAASAQVKITQQAQELASLKTPAKPEGLGIADKPATPDARVSLEQAITDAGMDIGATATTFGNTGDVPDGVMAALRAVRPGSTDADIKREAQGEMAIVQLRQTAQSQIRTEASALAGGDAQLDNLLSTARDFVPASEIEDINSRLQNPNSFKGAMRDIMEHHKVAVGAGGAQPLVGGSTPPSQAGGFTDFGEYTAALKAKQTGRADQATLNKLNATPMDLIDRANRPG